MLQDRQVTCWVVSDGKAGMENQALGVAEAAGFTPVVKRIRLRAPWRHLVPFVRAGLRWSFSPDGDPIAPPWPDVLIGTGRQSLAASLYVRQASAAAGRRTMVVQLQNPAIAASHFDLVVVPRHDDVTGPGIMTTRGGLHRMTPDLLKREAEKFQPMIAHLPSPRIAVLIGGNNAVYRLTPREMVPLTVQLAAMARSTGGSLLVTPSRRTGEANLALLKAGLNDVPAFIWDGTGYNPYYGMLALADAFVVTCDSVNMVSEACTTGKPVYVVDLPGGSDKFQRFHQSLRADGLTRAFDGTMESWSYEPLDDLDRVASRVRALLTMPPRPPGKDTPA